MKCYVSSIACCFQLGPLKNRWKSRQQGVLELGNLRRRAALAVWEIQSEGGKEDQKLLPSIEGGGGGVFFLELPMGLFSTVS